MQICAQINPVMEAITYFKHKACGRNICEISNKHVELLPEMKNELKECLRPIERLESILDSSITFSAELKSYFKCYDEGVGVRGIDPASLIFLKPSHMAFTDFESVRNEVLSYTDEEIRDNIMSALTINDGLNGENDLSCERFLKFVERQSFSEVGKWRVISTYNNFRRMAEELCDFIKPTVDIIISNGALYEGLLNEFRSIYINIDESPSRYLMNEYRVDIPAYENETLFPYLFGYSDVRSLYYDRPTQVSLTYVGVLVDFIVKRANSNIMPGGCDRALKALSDPNRIAIMKYLRDNRAYGQELAEQLRLSPNTISHHILKLQSAGLITAESEGNRIYYASNSRNIGILLRALDEMLLNKNRQISHKDSQ